ncbi:uncharacterized protein LOC135183679 [Pogoniulus pusillus]|uniref:uncharacterized protein LOC135183679 n=1 Tax=Pogoniulus pusillus TaxID=488313 RepID=UPI0030B953BF
MRCPAGTSASLSPGATTPRGTALRSSILWLSSAALHQRSPRVRGAERAESARRVRGECEAWLPSMGLSLSSRQAATGSLPALPSSHATAQGDCWLPLPASHMLQCELGITCLTAAPVPAGHMDTERDSAGWEGPEDLIRVLKEEVEEERSYRGQAELRAQQQAQQDLQRCTEQFLHAAEFPAADPGSQAELLLQPQQHHREAAQTLRPAAAAASTVAAPRDTREGPLAGESSTALLAPPEEQEKGPSAARVLAEEGTAEDSHRAALHSLRVHQGLLLDPRHNVVGSAEVSVQQQQLLAAKAVVQQVLCQAVQLVQEEQHRLAATPPAARRAPVRSPGVGSLTARDGLLLDQDGKIVGLAVLLEQEQPQAKPSTASLAPPPKPAAKAGRAQLGPAGQRRPSRFRRALRALRRAFCAPTCTRAQPQE